MRRMYSQTELAELVKNVFLADVESGEIDFASLIADAVTDGALEDTDVVVNTIIQKETNWEVDIKSILNTDFVKDSTKLYGKLVLLGNELSLVVSGQFTAKEDANTYKSLINNQNINIPDNIASKIFRADGTTLKENPSSTSDSNPYIASPTYVKLNPTIGNGNAIIYSNGSKNLSITIYGFGATNEDDVCYIDLRVQLVII